MILKIGLTLSTSLRVTRDRILSSVNLNWNWNAPLQNPTVKPKHDGVSGALQETVRFFFFAQVFFGLADE